MLVRKENRVIRQEGRVVQESVNILGIEDRIDKERELSKARNTLLIIKKFIETNSDISLDIDASVAFGNFHIYFREPGDKYSIMFISIWEGQSTLYYRVREDYGMSDSDLEKKRFLKSNNIEYCAEDIAKFALKEIQKLV